MSGASRNQYQRLNKLRLSQKKKTTRRTTAQQSCKESRPTPASADEFIPNLRTMLFSTFHCTRALAPSYSIGARALMVIPFLFFALAPLLTGQELSRSVVGTAGSYFSAVNVGNIHWTVGEIAVTRSENGLALEQGFHNGLYELIATSTWSAPEVQLEMRVFPNPTADKVTLAGDWEIRDRLRISDLLGRALSDTELPLERTELDLTNYPAGTYLLTISRAGRPLKTLRVVRR